LRKSRLRGRRFIKFSPSRFRCASPLRPNCQLFTKSAKLIGRFDLEFRGQAASLCGYLALRAAEIPGDLSVCFAAGEATQKLLLAWAQNKKMLRRHAGPPSVAENPIRIGAMFSCGA